MGVIGSYDTRVARGKEKLTGDCCAGSNATSNETGQCSWKNENVSYIRVMCMAQFDADTGRLGTIPEKKEGCYSGFGNVCRHVFFFNHLLNIVNYHR
jgi:hypothetical protein